MCEQLSHPMNLKAGDWIRWCEEIGGYVAGNAYRVTRADVDSGEFWLDADGRVGEVTWYMVPSGQYEVIPAPEGGAS